MYTVTVSDTKRDTLMPVIKEKIAPDSAVYTDGHTAYDTLSASEFHHFRTNHSKEFALNHTHNQRDRKFLVAGQAEFAEIQRDRAAEF